MIVVIADDLTGATELAGAAVEHGLTAEVQTRFDPVSKADVVALDTHTRSRPAQEAAQTVSSVSRAVFRAKPHWVYKKTDSVLRGNVRVEIEAILQAGGGNVRNALLVPANPSRGRVIRGGEYFVQGLPLEKTAFAGDPEHPRLTSRVSELLGASALIRIPDTATTASRAAHAQEMDSDTLPAGGVDFFSVLLKTRCSHTSKHSSRSGSSSANPSSTLFVCGSAAAWHQGRSGLCAELAIECLTMPAGLLERDNSPIARDEWAATATESLRRRRAAMIAIGPVSLSAGGLAPGELATRLAEVAAQVARTTGRIRLYAEGGTTARALIDCLGWTRLEAIRQWAPGTVELRARRSQLSVVCKVGSYDWPAELLAVTVPCPSPFAEPVRQPIDGVLDLHTFQPADLGELIPEYLAQCRARGLLEVRIIPGKGTGSLRRGVEAILRRLDTVESFAPAPAHRGGMGAVIVRLRHH